MPPVGKICLRYVSVERCQCWVIVLRSWGFGVVGLAGHGVHVNVPGSCGVRGSGIG